MEQTTQHPQGNSEVWVRHTAYQKECHEWAVSRFGNGAGLFNVITNIRAQRVPPRLTPPSRRRFPQGKALETLQRDTRLYLGGLMHRPEHSDCVGIEPQRESHTRHFLGCRGANRPEVVVTAGQNVAKEESGHSPMKGAAAMLEIGGYCSNLGMRALPCNVSRR